MPRKIQEVHKRDNPKGKPNRTNQNNTDLKLDCPTMKNSRRSRIIELLGCGKSDEEILQILDKEFSAGRFSTSNKQALYGTKRDLGLLEHTTGRRMNYAQEEPKPRDLTNDKEELIKQLRSFNAYPVIERYRNLDLSGKTPKDLLSFSMGSNIYRAFQYETPSQRYAKWRWYEQAELLYKGLLEIRDQHTFDTFLLDTASSLVEDWGVKNVYDKPSKMNIGIALKVTNLIFKHFSFSQPDTNPGLRRLLHVPWDSYTLGPLWNIWTGTPIMPLSPSQGFVKDLDTYTQLNILITYITQEAKVDRILYEFWAWNNPHPIHRQPLNLSDSRFLP